MKKIVESKLTRVVAFPENNSAEAGNLPVIPGINEFTEDEFVILNDHPDFKEKVKAGDFVFPMQESKVENDDAESELEAMPVKTAVKVIKRTENTVLLRQWAEETERAAVSTAIAKKLAEIEKDREEMEKAAAKKEAKKDGGAQS